jgi:CheY-like chemotaxis protein/HPt (histidine-containing phosphotransfer) domain-containing protein
VVTKLLEKLGYHAQVVINGQEALAALQTQPYDLVLMDCQMPEMDGFEATQRIRQPDSGVLNPSVPIIALTAHALKGDREKCLATGMNDYLSKPINGLELSAALEKWLPNVQHPVIAPPAAQPASTVLETDIFNETELLERLTGDQEIVRMVLAAFVEDTPRQIAALKQALAAGDLARVQRQGHTLKGASANLSAERLRRAALAFENLTEMPPFAGSASLSQLEAEFERFKAVLHQKGLA